MSVGGWRYYTPRAGGLILGCWGAGGRGGRGDLRTAGATGGVGVLAFFLLIIFRPVLANKDTRGEVRLFDMVGGGVAESGCGVLVSRPQGAVGGGGGWVRGVGVGGGGGVGVWSGGVEVVGGVL